MTARETVGRAAERALEPVETSLRPAYRWLFRLGRRGSRYAGPSGYDMAPGLMVVQKDEGAGAVHLWVAAFLHRQETDTLRVRVRLLDGDGVAVHAAHHDLTWFVIDDERVVTRWEPGSRLFHRHVPIPTTALRRGEDHTAVAEVVDVVDREHNPHVGEARCQVRLAPRRLEVGASLRVVVGSCYDSYTDDHARLPAAYAAHVPARLGGRPDLTLLLGDQVYADTPWWSYMLQARAVPRSSTLLEYWASWGMQTPRHRADGPGRGLGPVLTDGPTFFLPDDHEFWNNWPHASVTAKHSFLNQARGLFGGLARGLAAARELVAEPTVEVPEHPGDVPAGADERNHLPVHPDEWGRWSRGAFDLFGSFQTRSVREREGGPITRGEFSDDPRRDPTRPPRDGTPGVVHQPLTPPLQIVDLGPVCVSLLDTRTRRTRSRSHARWSRFVDDECLDHLLERAAGADLFVLAMPEPALQAPARWRPSLPGFSDFGIRHYVAQYTAFWNRLVEARAGRPTVLLGGDIHRSHVAHSTSHALVQVVASPFSLVYGYNTWERIKYRNESGPPPAGPLPGSWLPAERTIALRGHPDHRDGFAGLTLERIDAERYRLDVSLCPINLDDPVAAVRYDLVTAGPDIGVHRVRSADPAAQG
ncbi:hypothetical protein [Actinomycetospora cinnamomea]|uniref:PhoD-like phosphatase n=1 Tax=Actinomycetospora cinnamomea TaxID=663609 RepID=A0A2U1EX95_9PSEU|nr:hypothetical protein [Actinomycetospora cinnamomea]PVZ04573.1 hypothetical protein C8D89_11726 [Actinomycetospora cinnamomea]